MKKYLIVLVILFSNHAMSYCPQYIVTSPLENKSLINQNQSLVIYLTNFPFIQNLDRLIPENSQADNNSKIKFYFVSDKHAVLADTLKYFQGDSRHNQFIIKPTAPLLNGRKYVLEIRVFNKTKNIFEVFPYKSDISWKVSTSKYILVPESINKSSFLENTFIQFGCGDLSISSFKVYAPEGSIVISELIDSKTKEIKHSIEVVMNNEVSIGTEMCGGAYLLKRKSPYKIRFKLFEPEHETIWGDFINFQSP